MASSDATFTPVKNQAYRVTFPILDSDGDLVAGATGLDSEVSKDGGTFTDCSGEASQIAASSGMYYLDLTASEMNADTVAVIVKSTEGKTVPIVIYPQEAGTELKVDVTHIAGAAVNTASAQLGVNVVNFGGSAGTFASGIPSAVLTSSGVNAVADQIWDEDITTHRTANSAGAVLQPIRSGTCQNGGDTTHVILDASASATTDAYKYQIIVGWKASDGSNKFAGICSGYNGTTKSATVNTIPYSPDNTYTFNILPFGSVPGASAPTAGEVADAVWDEAMSGHVTSGTYGQSMQAEISHTGTAAGGSTSSITLQVGASATDNLYRYHRVELLSGTGAGQVSYGTSYVGSTRVLSVDPQFAVAPSTDTVYVLRKLGLDAATPGVVADAVWDEPRSGHAVTGSFGDYVFSDATRINGNATSAANLANACNGTGYNFPNTTIPTVTTVGTLTTYTGNTPQTGDAFARLGAPAGASHSADVAAVKVDTAAILADTGTDGVVVAAASKTGYALSTAGVDAILDDPITEPGGVFAWGSATLRNIIGYLGAKATNKQTQTATVFTLRNRADGANISTATVSDNGTTASKGSES